MAPHSKTGTTALGKTIREQRESLGLTIDEAARKSGVSSKTWSRYEAGSSIRSDKVRSVLMTLKWDSFPDGSKESDGNLFKSIDFNHEAWSKELETNFGKKTAACFAAACDIIHDYVKQDLEELKPKPRGTHLGEVDVSWLVDNLPAQFLMRYDYEFVYALKQTVNKFRRWAKFGVDLTPHSVLDEIFLHLVDIELEELFELFDLGDYLEDELPEGFLGELSGDIDLVTLLYSDHFLVMPGDGYHFDNWLKEQFWVS